MLTRDEKAHSRTVRYRRLALAEQDPEKAKLLQQIADEAERGVLVTPDWMSPGTYMNEPPKPDQDSKSSVRPLS
jgi:hypothetical protein